MAGNNREARSAADHISRQEKREHWNCDAFLSLNPESMDGAGTDDEYRRAVIAANLIVMPLDEPSVATWHGFDDAQRQERMLPFAEFLHARYPHARLLVLFVANNLVVGRIVWLRGESSPDVTICHEALPLEEIEPELLAYLPHGEQE